MLKHSVLEGFRNLARSFWLSATAIFIIFVSLTSVALVSSLWVVSGYMIKKFDNQAIIYVDLKRETTEVERKELISDLQSLGEIVKEVTFIDKEKAKAEFGNNPFSSRSYDALVAAEKTAASSGSSTDLLIESIKVVPSSSQTYKDVEDFVNAEKYKPFIKNIDGSKDFIDALQRLYFGSAIFGSLFVVIFSLISILVIINILRIAIYSRRDEIEIMRLVGATNSYIRGPFIAEGILYNFIASIFVFVLFIPLFNYLTPLLQAAFNLPATTNFSEVAFGLYIALTITNIVGLVIGGFSAMLATQRYMKL
jgi:cell division transport system permease protein